MGAAFCFSETFRCNDMQFGSVCSGIEAASVAWAPLGWQAAWFSEIEAFPRAVLAHHYPKVPNYGDARQLPQLIRAGFAEAPDVLCGGTPCQAFSVAGLRRSLDDERGNLTLTFCEIADAIDERRDEPCVILWENVPGVLSTKDNAFGCLLGALAGEDCALVPPGPRWEDAGLVFGPARAVAWRILDAQFFGLAQRRRRVFVVASARGGFDPAAVLLEWEGVRRDSAPSREAGQRAPGAAESGAAERSIVGPLKSNQGPAGHGFGDMLSNQSVDAGHVLAFGGNDTRGPIDIAAAVNANRGCHSPGDFEAGTLLTYSITPAAGQGAALQAVQVDVASGLSAVTMGEQTDRGIRVLAFDTTQITHPENRSNPRPGDPCHPLAAGAHVPAVAFDTYNQDLNQHVTHALRDGNSEGTPAVLSAMQVRRLTPRECERLQGFQDDHTLIPWRGKPASECPDGPRYRALGNSWAVPVVRWIGARIQRELTR